MEKRFTWEKIALPNKEKERNKIEISAMRLDYFLTNEAIGKNRNTHCKIMDNSIIRTDHNPVWMAIKNPWNNTKEEVVIREKIIKINTKNRDNKSKEKVLKIYKETHNKNINKIVKEIKNIFCQEKLDSIIKEINNEMYDISKKVYGEKGGIEEKDPKEKIKNLE
jgi:hypothetical protein